MELSVAILVVGSLYWEQSNSRESWRSKRLDLEQFASVHAPIRYGRKSSGRHYTYTMVFAKSVVAPNLGRALAVPCKQPIRSIDDLVVEAESLWTAERDADMGDHRISAEWGCVALVVNPHSNVPTDIRDGWAKRVGCESGYGKLRFAPKESEIVGADGIMQIPWPDSADGSPLQQDLLLATATDPTLENNRYPTTAEIAREWNRSPDDACYFWNNKKCGICTFQDEEIEAKLLEDAKLRSF